VEVGVMIKGKKVYFRPIEEADLKFCQSLYNDELMRQFVVGWDFPVSYYSQEKWFTSLSGNHNNIRFIICNLKDEPLGLTGLWDIDWHNRNALTAIKIRRDKKLEKGLGHDAIMTMNAYAFFEVGLYRLWGQIIDYNIPSYKAYVGKSGWKLEGVLREHIFRNGIFHDLFYVACLKKDFLEVSDAQDYIPPEIPLGMKKMDLAELSIK
jgi:RimJ/RimL family protein N-acetyltransferase